jgi:hypothetical protein
MSRAWEVVAGDDRYLVRLVDGDEMDVALPVLLRFRWAVQADRSARRLATDPGAGADLRAARLALESMAR